ncbi:hypothetical protein HGRIS_002342 [Hohenbuehelia grisea]|uniref:Uncharacterized protein n=1 Tax=Hohenbuehelia grisea TaxID=104357 RepID=A0ABR3JKX6_9AGAR
MSPGNKNGESSTLTSSSLQAVLAAAALSRPLPQPAVGSANPAASFPALWSYILPALDHIVRSHTNDNTKPPSIDIAFYSGIHSACYNYFTSPSDLMGAVQVPARIDDSGNEFYEHLDKYFTDVARELLLGAPTDDSALLAYVLPHFSRFSASAKSVNRLLNYFNRHYVKRCVDEDKGWLRLSDIFEPEQTIVLSATNGTENFAAQIQQKRLEELTKWGFVKGGSAASQAEAEACAEAASSLDRIIPLSSLAHRHLRIEFLEPLISVQKAGNKPRGKKKIPKSTPTPIPAALAPKGRLGRAVEQLISSPSVASKDKTRTLQDLSYALKTVGVRPTHPLRKRLDAYLK